MNLAPGACDMSADRYYVPLRSAWGDRCEAHLDRSDRRALRHVYRAMRLAMPEAIARYEIIDIARWLELAHEDWTDGRYVA